MKAISIQPLSADRFHPFGSVLGTAGAFDDGRGAPAFRNADTDFWRQHLFEASESGETELLGVNYRNRQREIDSLEVHRLTQQAVIALSGQIIQVVAMSQEDGSPDLENLSAFRIRLGEGVCMLAGVWHTTRVNAKEVNCLMVTRRSTTIDLAAHLTNGSALSESAIVAIAGFLLV